MLTLGLIEADIPVGNSLQIEAQQSLCRVSIAQTDLKTAYTEV